MPAIDNRYGGLIIELRRVEVEAFFFSLKTHLGMRNMMWIPYLLLEEQRARIKCR